MCYFWWVRGCPVATDDGIYNSCCICPHHHAPGSQDTLTGSEMSSRLNRNPGSAGPVLRPSATWTSSTCERREVMHGGVPALLSIFICLAIVRMGVWRRSMRRVWTRDTRVKLRSASALPRLPSSSTTSGRIFASCARRECGCSCTMSLCFSRGPFPFCNPVLGSGGRAVISVQAEWGVP